MHDSAYNSRKSCIFRLAIWSMSSQLRTAKKNIIDCRKHKMSTFYIFLRWKFASGLTSLYVTAVSIKWPHRQLIKSNTRFVHVCLNSSGGPPVIEDIGYGLGGLPDKRIAKFRRGKRRDEGTMKQRERVNSSSDEFELSSAATITCFGV